MCLFNFPNRSSIKARVKGIESFDCGGCPECLQKKSRMWALRCSMEARVSPAVMVTLTYDTYKYAYGHEENPTNPNIPLSKRDCQLFIKRLRKHFSCNQIKYLITAERGKRTHRAHYHAILFGVVFDDLVKYKKSDRGNWIYKSKTLDKIWQNGICTVDCINVSAKVARYCTKYCCKDSGVDDTFMLFSHGIGMSELVKKFNGKSYWIDGREYSIPKQVWQWYIEKKYRIYGFSKYQGKPKLQDVEKQIYNYVMHNNINKDIEDKFIKRKLNSLLYRNITHLRGKEKNEYYCFVRDNDSVYKNYLNYWKNKAEIYKKTLTSVFDRIRSLPDDKYRSYKIKALNCFNIQTKNRSKKLGISFIPPRTNCHGFDICYKKPDVVECAFAPLSRHYRANDTINKNQWKILQNIRRNYCIKEVENELLRNLQIF